MNENDVQDREVLDYVRNRMAADMPPEFTRDVMNDVHRTTQRRRGFAWPILTGLATVAAAAAVVVIGLGLINQPNDVGSGPSPSASTSRRSRRRRASRRRRHPARPPRRLRQSSQHRPRRSSRRPARANSDRSTRWHRRMRSRTHRPARSQDAIVNGEPTDLGWTDLLPRGLVNQRGRHRLPLGMHAVRVGALRGADDQTIHRSVAIVTNMPPGGDFTTAVEITHRGVHRRRRRGACATRSQASRRRLRVPTRWSSGSSRSPATCPPRATTSPTSSSGRTPVTPTSWPRGPTCSTGWWRHSISASRSNPRIQPGGGARRSRLRLPLCTSASGVATARDFAVDLAHVLLTAPSHLGLRSHVIPQCAPML